MRESIQQFLDKIKAISYEYEVTRLVLVFLGASLIIVATQFLGGEISNLANQLTQENYQITQLESQIKNAMINEEKTILLENQLSSTRQTQIVTFISTALLAIALFFTPVVLSLIFTKISLKKRIIPPSFMQIVVFSYFLIFFAYSQDIPETQRSSTMMILTIYTIVAGITQTTFVMWLIGIKASDTDMIKNSLKLYTTLTDLENFLTSEPRRSGLYLKREIEETRNGILLKSIDGRRYETWIDISESSKPNEVFLNMVNFEKGMYELKKSLGLEIYAEKQFLFLKQKLSEPYPPIRFEVVSSSNADRLSEEILEENKGVYSQIGGISKMVAFKIFLFMVSAGLLGYLYYVGDSTNAVLGAITMFLYLVFELSRFTKHKLSPMRRPFAS